MRLTQSREVALPLLLVLTGTLLLMDRLDLIRISHLAQLWPVILIAFGLQELYSWTVSGGSARRKE
jgi:hypothetical protein